MGSSHLNFSSLSGWWCYEWKSWKQLVYRGLGRTRVRKKNRVRFHSAVKYPSKCLQLVITSSETGYHDVNWISTPTILTKEGGHGIVIVIHNPISETRCIVDHSMDELLRSPTLLNIYAWILNTYIGQMRSSCHMHNASDNWTIKHDTNTIIKLQQQSDWLINVSCGSLSNASSV